jgi:hypothetical protein
MIEQTDDERDALAMWDRSDQSRDAVLAAVRHAIGATELRFEQSEDFRIAAADRALAEISGMLDRFATFGDPGRTRAFVTDLGQIVAKAQAVTR